MPAYALVLAFWLADVDAASATAGFIFVGSLVIFGLAAYFLPSIIAHSRHHHNRVPITLVNLFFGWTAIGWLIALIWAFTSPAPNQVVVVQQASPPPRESGSALD